MKPFSIHLLQWRVAPGNMEENLATARRLVGEIATRPGDMVLLPEMFSSGFYYESLERFAGRAPEVREWMADTASAKGVAIAGSMAVPRTDGIANRMTLVDPHGRTLAAYDKIHLFPVALEDQYFVPGNGTVTAHWQGLEVGLAICFDLRFPEMTSRLRRDGGLLVIVSAQWPRARVEHFRALTKVRAMENQIFVAACNSCGDDGKGLVLGGNSTVVGPAGDVKGALGEGEGVLSVAIDPEEVSQVREGFPVLSMRRTDLFGE